MTIYHATTSVEETRAKMKEMILMNFGDFDLNKELLGLIN